MAAISTRNELLLDGKMSATKPTTHLKIATFDENEPGTSPNRPAGLPQRGPGFRRLEPSPELFEELKAASSRLETATPEEIIAWGVEHYGPYLTMATAFGP